MAARTLAEAGIGQRLRIVAIALEPDDAAWLAAFGLHVGERLSVRRRAAFGGPLHVKTASGGEFAVAREVAGAIEIEIESNAP